MSVDYEFHEFSKSNRLMNPLEFRALVEDIRANGLMMPIILFEVKILDGRNRYLACKELGIEPRFIEFEGDRLAALNYAISMENRRHATTSEKACAAVLFIPKLEEETKSIVAENKRLIGIASKKPKKERAAILKGIVNINHNQKAAELLAVSESYVEKAKSIFKHYPEEFEAIRNGIFEINHLKKVLEIKSKSIKLYQQLIDGKLTLKQAFEGLSKSTIIEKQLNPVSAEPTSGTPEISHQEVNYKRTDLKKTELKKLQDLLEIGAIEQKAINKIVSQRRQVAIKDPDNEVKKTLKVILNESEKLKLDEICKRRNLTKTDLLKQFIKKLK